MACNVVGDVGLLQYAGFRGKYTFACMHVSTERSEQFYCAIWCTDCKVMVGPARL